MFGLEGFVDSSRVEARLAARVAQAGRVERRSRVAAGEQITAAREQAAEAAWHYRSVYAEVLAVEQRRRKPSRALLARLQAALVAMDEANDAVSALLGDRLAA